MIIIYSLVGLLIALQGFTIILCLTKKKPIGQVFKFAILLQFLIPFLAFTYLFTWNSINPATSSTESFGEGGDRFFIILGFSIKSICFTLPIASLMAFIRLVRF